MDKQTDASVTVVIVAYNSEGVIARAIDSVPRTAGLLIIDNASRTPVGDVVPRGRAEIIRNETNIGFGPACNMAARAARSEYLFFLNPDAEIEGDALETLVRTAREMAGVGGAFAPLLVAGERVVPPRAGTMLDRDGPKYISEIGEDPRVVDFISGAAFLVERKFFLEIGGFDENIFLYLEDDDLSLRLRDSGRPPVLVPRARVRHFEASQNGVPFRLIVRKNYHSVTSLLYLSGKYRTPLNTWGMKSKAARRALVAALRFDRVRLAKNLGRLAALCGVRLN